MENKTEAQTQDLSKVISRRNFYIRRFFAENGVDITLMGDYNNPLLVIKDNIVLSAFVHNFDLIFKDDAYGNDVFRVKLMYSPELIKTKLAQWIVEAKHRKVYLFTAKGFYFHKFTKHLNNQRPLFTPQKDLAYYVFSRQKALEVKEELKRTEPAIDIIY